MVVMSYREFMENVKKRLNKMTKNEMEELILHWAEKEHNSRREFFINRLSPPVEPIITETDSEELLDEIEALAKRVENGDYCDGWGWDDDIYEERDWGDESWVGEADDYFMKARELLINGYYEQATIAYRRLFEIMEMGEEPGHLPGDLNSYDMLKVDFAEQVNLYLRAIYMNSPSPERLLRLFKTMNRYSCLSENIGLKDMINVLDSDLPDLNDFLTDWITYLKEQNNFSLSKLLREAVAIKGGISGISELARQHADRYPRAFLDWIIALEKEGKEDSVLSVAREGLATIPKDYQVRAEVAEIISRLGEELNDSKMKLEGYMESFYSNPSTDHLLNLYTTALECDCFESMQDRVEQRVWELFREGLMQEYNYYDSELSLSYLAKGVLYRTLVLGGKYIELFELCKGNGPLGWTDGNNPKPYFIIFTMVLLSSSGKNSTMINKLWDSLLTGSIYEIDKKNEQANAYKKIIDYTSKYVQLNEEQEAYYLKWCIEQIGKRVDKIIGNKYRNSYNKAADLLLAMAETLKNRGEADNAAALILKYRKKYPKHSAFKRELARSMQESGAFE